MNNITMDDIGKVKKQEYSEIDLFNKIGLMTIAFGYKAIYFKTLMPKMVENEGGYTIELKYLHYVHLYMDGDIKYSILFDEDNIASTFPEKPYFELFDRLNMEKFLDTEEGRSGLLIRLSTLICNSKTNY